MHITIKIGVKLKIINQNSNGVKLLTNSLPKNISITTKRTIPCNRYIL